MSEEEKKALENLNKLLEDWDNNDISEIDLFRIYSLIEKQDKVIDRLSNSVMVQSVALNKGKFNCGYDTSYTCELNKEGYRKYSCKDCVKKYYFEEVMKDE